MRQELAARLLARVYEDGGDGKKAEQVVVKLHEEKVYGQVLVDEILEEGGGRESREL